MHLALYQIEVQQYRWLVLALVGGLAAVLATLLVYLAFWRQRGQTVREEYETGRVETASRQPTTWGWLRAFMPLFLILTYLGMLAFTIVYFARAARNPPNW